MITKSRIFKWINFIYRVLGILVIDMIISINLLFANNVNYAKKINYFQ